jgi:hypothetical protein
MKKSVNTIITRMQKKVGRPPSQMPPYRPFQMKVPDSFLTMIDDWRRLQPDVPSRAEAIRRLCAKAVASEASSKRKTKS